MKGRENAARERRNKAGARRLGAKGRGAGEHQCVVPEEERRKERVPVSRTIPDIRFANEDHTWKEVWGMGLSREEGFQDRYSRLEDWTEVGGDS